MPHVLLVDDEEPLRESLGYTLSREGYEVTTAADGPSALEQARSSSPDIILLDLMLPGMDGGEVCRRIRSWSGVPIVMLTAKDQESDKIDGLEIGADDYVTKPFSTRELLARMKAVLRRYEAAPPHPAEPEVLEGGGIRMDLSRHEVTLNGHIVELSPREFQLLRTLMSGAGRALGRDELMDSVWGRDYVGDGKTLDVHIRWLREKLEADPGAPEHIQTVRGVGYRFG